MNKNKSCSIYNR